MSDTNTPRDWEDIAIGLYDRLTGRGARIDYEFDAFQVGVPRDSNDSAPAATWRLDGTIRVSTQDSTNR